MNGLQEMVLIREVALQSKIAQRAAERLQATQETFDQVEVWCSIQSILVAAGNVSKILWPIRKEYKLRGESLPHLLKVDDDNILSDRKFRNHFEHYDERIDDWFSNQTSAVYSDLAMNPSLMTPSLPESMSKNHRGYNSFNNTLVFRGESLDLNEVLRALEDIFSNCKPHSLT
jgi:hypothetical protein